MISLGMTSMCVVISEGKTAASRAKMIQTMGWTSSELLAQLLKRHVPSIETDIVFPTDRDPKSCAPLEFYDGILFTGSTSNIHKREPETRGQFDVAINTYSSTAQVERAADVMSRLPKSCEIPTGDSNQIASIEPHQFELRPLEILNWLEHSVAPSSGRVR